MGRDPGEIYAGLEREFGVSSYERIDAPANAEQRAALAKLSPQDITVTELAGEKIQKILTTAPGDGSPIGGIKVIAENGWFAARPSGTEDVYKIYAESFPRPRAPEEDPGRSSGHGRRGVGSRRAESSPRHNSARSPIRSTLMSAGGYFLKISGSCA